MDCKMPSLSSSDPEERSLFSFMHHMRAAKRGKGKYTLTPEHIKILESIPGWKWDDFNKREENCKFLKNWVTENGRLPSRRSDDKDEKFSYNLIRKMREVKTNKLGKFKEPLSQECIEILESIPGFKWNPFKDRLLSNCKGLKEWIELHNRVPLKCDDKEERAFWNLCQDLRKCRYKRGTLKQEIIDFVDTIPLFDWKPKDNLYKCYELKEWMLENGRLTSKNAKTDPERMLHNFVTTMRKAKRGKGYTITDEHIKILESIPNWSWGRI